MYGVIPESSATSSNDRVERNESKDPVRGGVDSCSCNDKRPNHFPAVGAFLTILTCSKINGVARKNRDKAYNSVDKAEEAQAAGIQPPLPAEMSSPPEIYAARCFESDGRDQIRAFTYDDSLG